jgi:hypothetical protein
MRSGKYLLTATQLIYVVTSQGRAYRSGSAFLYHSSDVVFDELKAETIDLASGIRSFCNYQWTPRANGRVVAELAEGTKIRLVFLPYDLRGDRLAVAANSAQNFFCRTAEAFGADGVPDPPA